MALARRTRRRYIEQTSLIVGDCDVMKIPFLIQTGGFFEWDTWLDLDRLEDIAVYVEIHKKKVEVYNITRNICKFIHVN